MSMVDDLSTAEKLLSGKNVTEDKDKAFRIFSEYAEKGNSYAQYWCGICCLFGWGISKSDTNAKAMFEKAAKQGHAYAQYELGRCYLGEKNFEKAAELMKLKITDPLPYFLKHPLSEFNMSLD